MAYEESIIFSGGRLVECSALHPETEITFGRKIINPGLPHADDHIEITCKLIVPKESFENIIRTIEDFDNEAQMKEINNLIILGTEKTTDNLYHQKLSAADLGITYDKKENVAKLTFSLTTTNTATKTDHPGIPGKTDHSGIPQIK